VWEDITDRLRAFTIDRGRSSELDRAEAGVATFDLDNFEGDFDPSNIDGPYFPGLKPMRRIRIQAVIPETFASFYIGSSFVGGSDVLGTSVAFIGLFSGFVEDWGQTWNPMPAPHPDSVATVRAVDAFKVLLSARGVTPMPSFNPGSAVNEILDHMGWPADERNIELTGGYIVDVAGGSLAVILPAIQAIDASEGGLFFAARDGRLTFFTHSHVQAFPPSAEDIWGDALDERQYQSITLSYEDSVIWNEVVVTSAAGSVQVSDLVSQDHYLWQRTELSTDLASLTEMTARAQDHLSRFSTPRQRIVGLEVGVRDDVEWPSILNHDLLDRIIVKRRPLGTEPGIVQDSVIQRISIRSPSRKQWSVVWALSATPRSNLLTPNQSSLETDTSGWVAVTNCTIARSTTTPPQGVGTLTMTAVGAGDMSASTTPNTQLVVTPGAVYSAMAAFYKQAGGRNCHVEIVWRDSGGSILSTSTGNVESDADNIVQSAVSAIAPVSAAFATVLVVVASATAGEVHRVDMVGFVDGEQTGWSPGQG
jgi:hypothetical protein